jgi:hypothetical protein
MLKKYEQKLTPSSNAFKQKSESKSSAVFLQASKILISFIFCVGCASTSRVLSKEAQFYSGKAEIFDKRKNKNERVYFYVSVLPPDLFRMDVTVGVLNIPLGTLIMRGNEAQFVNLTERKNYRSKDGSRTLEKLLKAPMKPQHIVSIFTEKFPLSAPWQCRLEKETSAKCETVELFLDWTRLEGADRLLKIESEKSTISMNYRAGQKKNASFEWLQPSGFDEIWLAM